MNVEDTMLHKENFWLWSSILVEGKLNILNASIRILNYVLLHGSVVSATIMYPRVSMTVHH